MSRSFRHAPAFYQRGRATHWQKASANRRLRRAVTTSLHDWDERRPLPALREVSARRDVLGYRWHHFGYCYSCHWQSPYLHRCGWVDEPWKWRSK